jgi:tRNA A-37 threonylcarbamoyl transferase component Bud32/tetratricopeptide (TPR) repeat protein
MPDDTIERLTAALSDRYRVERQVGQGGMATVFLAEDVKHHRRVAIKVLRAELSATLGTERFLREIELAAKLQHPHIVPVYDSGTADGVLYYVMPYVEGESLRDLMRREGRVPLSRAAEIIREAASGLEYAHGHGIVHRDVKPENIMLSGGHAVVADFGIARAIDASRAAEGHLTGAGMAIGTPAYMSPEQATADTVDARSDQYALACVFYELVTGKQAFAGPTMQAMLTNMLTGPRPRLSAMVDGIPPEVDGATQRALSTDPKHRFDSISGFARAVTQETSGAAMATRESRRWKRLAIVLPVLVAVAAATWAVFFGPGRRVVVSGAETIAVVPFSVSGTGLEGIGEGMVDLLSVNLDGVGPIRTIEPRSVLREWRRRVDAGQTGDLDDAIAVARNTRAASVLTGSIVTAGGTARMNAELYDLDGARIGTAVIDGPVDSVLVLADGLALALLRDIWKSREPLPSANATGITSASMPAIRAYLRGERYHRRGEWDSAQVAFETAVAADSTFALAWYRLANTLGWKGLYNNPVALTASANAVRFSDSLPPRMRSLLVAYDFFSRGQNATAADSARAYLTRYPQDADGWYLLGEAQYHGRGFRPLPPDDLREPFDRVLALDSSLAPAAIHPMELAVSSGDTALLRRYEVVFRSAGSESELTRASQVRRALAGDDSAFVAMFDNPIGAGLALASLLGRFGDPEVDTDRLLQSAIEISRDPPPTQFGTQLRSMGGLIAQSLGRTDSARSLIRGIPPSPNGGDLSMYVRSIPIFAGYADSTLRAQMSAALSNAPANQFVATWRALIALDSRDPRTAQAIARQVIANPDTLQRFIHGALMGVDGLATVALGDTARGMAVVDSALKLIGGVTATGFTFPIQVRYAMLLTSRAGTRAEGIRRLKYGFPNAPEMYPILQYYLARAYESAEQPDSAAASYGQFLRLWANSDSVYRPIVAEARAGLERVTGESRGSGSPVAPAPQ